MGRTGKDPKEGKSTQLSSFDDDLPAGKKMSLLGKRTRQQMSFHKSAPGTEEPDL